MDNTLDSEKIAEFEKRISECLTECIESKGSLVVNGQTQHQFYIPGSVSESENRVLTKRLLQDERWSAVFIYNIARTGMIEVKIYEKRKLEQTI